MVTRWTRTIPPVKCAEKCTSGWNVRVYSQDPWRMCVVSRTSDVREITCMVCFCLQRNSKLFANTNRQQFSSSKYALQLCATSTKLTHTSLFIQFQIKLVRSSLSNSALCMHVLFGKCDFHCHKYESTTLNRYIRCCESRKANKPASFTLQIWRGLIESITSLVLHFALVKPISLLWI